MTKIRNEEYVKAFGAHIKKLRLERKLSQYKLAYMAEVDRSQIIGIENGKINTTISTVLVLAKAFETSPSVLLDFPGSKKHLK